MHKYLSLAAIDTTTYIIDIILGCDKEHDTGGILI